MKKIKLCLLTGLMLTLLTACMPSQTKLEEVKVDKNNSKTEEIKEEKDIKKIGVIQLMSHTSLNIIYDAFYDELGNLGYVDGENIELDFQNAQGDISNITSIVQTFKGDKKDVVLAITTPVAQSAMALTEQTPVIFSAVTDPIAAGIVTDFNVTDKNITGTSDIIQVDKILDLAVEITPDIKTIGYIYNAGEDNSVTNLKKAKEYADKYNLNIIESAISSSSELQSASQNMVTKVDAIFVANDNTVAESMPILMKVANTAKVPVYCGADSMIMDGGFATVGIDYTDLGKESAKMVDRILKGEKVSDIPVKIFDEELYTYINIDTAKELGIEIPKNILESDRYKEIKNK